MGGLKAFVRCPGRRTRHCEKKASRLKARPARSQWRAAGCGRSHVADRLVWPPRYFCPVSAGPTPT